MSELCTARLRCRLAALVLALPLAPAAVAAAPQADATAAAEPESVLTWIGSEDEFEAYLRQAEVVDLQPIGIGVTNPWRAELAPGGPIEAFAWKPIRAGTYLGYWESYEAEVAAYALDRLLGLGMVPVTVERRVGAEMGAAAMWLSPTRSFREMGGMPTPPPEHAERFYMQITRAKMFDNLINNRDPNEGNWLVDPAWNLFLIDHSRAFTRGTRMVHEMVRVDRDLWQRMQQLDEASLTAALGDWLNGPQIRSILKRRDRMAREIDKLVAARGEAAVLVRAAEPPR